MKDESLTLDKNVLLEPQPPPSPRSIHSSRFTRLKHFFPLVKSRSATHLPAIITTSPTVQDLNPRLSNSSVENASTFSSSRNVSRTHLHVLTSAAMAAAVGGRIHFDESRVSEDRPSPKIQEEQSLLKKLIPSFRRRRKNDSVHSIELSRSAPASPKLYPQNQLPRLQSSESMPSTTPILPPSTPIASPLLSPSIVPLRGRSSTVSSASSDRRTRRTSTMFGLKGSGRGTPIEKLSFEEEELDLPKREGTAEEYLKKLHSEGLSKYIRKLVESRYSLQGY